MPAGVIREGDVILDIGSESDRENQLLVQLRQAGQTEIAG